MEEKEQILELLRQKGVAFEEYEHEALASVMDRVEKGLCYDAVICKNLFVATRKKDRVFLVMLRAEKRADLHGLAHALGTPHLGFAPVELLAQLLHQRPGAVGPLGILRDQGARVEVVFDESLRHVPRVAMHPSVNTATVVLAFDELERIIRQNGNRIYYKEFQ